MKFQLYKNQQIDENDFLNLLNDEEYTYFVSHFKDTQSELFNSTGFKVIDYEKVSDDELKNDQS